MVRQGTTTVAAYCSVHKESAEAFFAEAAERNMLVIAGKVMMDRNAPEGVRDTPQSGYDDSKALIAAWHGKGRALYAITPRFAITSSPEQMQMAGALLAEHPDCHMQTHLSENHAEIAFTQELYPWSRDYTDIYEHYGLLGPKEPVRPLHPSVRTRGRCAVGFGFGGGVLPDLQPVPRLRPVRLPALPHAGRSRCRIATATDVGGGTNYSMLRTMDEGYKVIALNGEKLNPLASFWQLTAGNAEALSIGDRVGRLEAGKDADIVVLNSSATPGDAAQDGDRRDACGRIVSAANARRRPRRRRDLRRRSARQERAAGIGRRGQHGIEGDGNGRQRRHREDCRPGGGAGVPGIR